MIIALSFLRNALGTQQTPPNQILIGLALVLTMFVMGPIFSEINETALTPFNEGTLTQEEALTLAMEPIREFMLNQVSDRDLALFADLSGSTYTAETLPDRVIIPAFVIGEMTKGFMFGVLVFIPFIVIDMVTASILMGMGMMMLPPVMISLPFKVLTFILAGGFNIIVENLIRTFRF